MSGTVTIAATVITSLTAIATGMFAARSAWRIRRLDAKSAESAQVLDAWKDLTGPLREENARLAERLRQAEERHDEDEAVQTALAAQNALLHEQNVEMRAEITRLRKERRRDRDT